MRNIVRKIRLVSYAAVVVAGFCACAEDVMSSMFRTSINLGASTDMYVTEQAATRAGLDIQGSSFDPEEKIRVYILGVDGDTDADVCNPTDDEPTGHDSFFTTEEMDETTRLNPLSHTPTLYYPTEKRHVDIHAYYPSRVKKTDETFSVEYDQRGKDEAGTLKYKNSDLMFAKIDNQPPTTGNVNLNFRHKMVKFIFNVVGDGDVTIKRSYLTGVNRTAGFDAETGEITVLTDEHESNRGDVELDDAGAVLIPPQTLLGDFIAVECHAEEDGQEDKDGIAMFSLTNPKELKEGKVYTVNLSIAYDNVGATYEIDTWNEDAGVISVASKGTSGLSIIKKETVKGEEKVYMQESYIYTTDSIKPEPLVRYGKAKTLTKGLDYELQYFDDIHIGKATILVIGKGSYEGFAVATSFTIEQAEGIVKYTEEDGETDKTQVDKTYTRNSIVVDPDDIKLTIVDNGTRHFATYLADEDGNPIENVESATAADKIASIDHSGTVTIKGSGTVIVKAWTDGDGDYTAASDTYKLVVHPRDYTDETSQLSVEVTGGPYTYNTKEQVPEVKVYDGVGENKVDITASCIITIDDKISASRVISEDIEVENTNLRGRGTAIRIVFNAPYSGETYRYYLIQKATPNLRLYNGYDLSTALTKSEDGKFPDLYLALPNGNVSSDDDRTRTRIAITDFGVASITTTSTPSVLTQTTSDAVGNASETSDFDHNTTATFIAKGRNEGDVTYTVAVDEDTNGNYYGASATFVAKVVKSVDNYECTGGTQIFNCQATGEYLLEVWGAQGGWANDDYLDSPKGLTFRGGAGGYVQARIKLIKGEKLYVNVGEKGDVVTWNYSKAGYSSYTKALGYNAYNDPTVNTSNVTQPVQDSSVGMLATGQATNKVFVVGAAWNGGAGNVWGLRHHNTHTRAGWFCVRDPLSGGGGATDISLKWSGNANNWKTPEHLLTRIIVAGGGGGACYYSGESGSGNGPSGGGGTQWSGYTTTISVTDPGEGGKLWRGGFGGTNRGIGAAGDSYVTSEYPRNALYSGSNYCRSYTNYYDGRESGWSGADGIFGEGGYYYCIEEGSGAGGGGWYGGGAAGQSGGNGPAGGGSSYVWTNEITKGGHTLDYYYPTASTLGNFTTTATVNTRAWNYMYKNSSVQNPNQLNFRYLYSASSTANANEGSSNTDPADGKAKITLLSTTDEVDLGTRTYINNN